MLSRSCLRHVYLNSSTLTRCATNSALDLLHTPKVNPPSNQLWKFKSNVQAEQKVLEKTNKTLLNNPRRSYPVCLEAAAQMKLAGTPPDFQIYYALMMSAASAGACEQAWAILDDMLLVGIKPNVEIFNFLIHAHRLRSSRVQWLIFDKMNELGVLPNGKTYSWLITLFTADRNLELALRYFSEMKSCGLRPQVKSIQEIILLAAELGHPRLAIDIATWFEAEVGKTLEQSVWLKCLTSSAQECYANGVSHCWRIVTGNLGITPDEGACLAVLYAAARHGLADLATDVLRVLKSAGMEWQEHHFASVVEAFCRNSQLKEALETLNVMRNDNILPTSKTTRSILEVISASPDTIDNTWQIIDEIQKEHEQVDTAILNVLVQASVQLGDLQRAMGSYKSFKEYHASPDVETFTHLLDGCINLKHRKLGDVLLDEMKTTNVTPNMDIFERMIHLCLTQETYEDAFFHLEEMKAAGYVPPLRTYVGIVRRCMEANDARYRMALEEMKEIGYSCPRSLEEEIRDYEQLARTSEVSAWSG